MQELSEAIKLQENLAPAYYWKGVINKAKPLIAIKDFSKAIECNPFYADAYNERSKTYSQIGEKQKADEDLKKALELKPTLKTQNQQN